MLTKEHGVTVLAVCAVYDLFVHSKLKPKELPLALFQVSPFSIGLPVSLPFSLASRPLAAFLPRFLDFFLA